MKRPLNTYKKLDVASTQMMVLKSNLNNGSNFCKKMTKSDISKF